MSKDKNYTRLVTSQRWTRLAYQLKTECHWQCQRCHTVTNHLAAHHIIPIETMSKEKMEEYCFKRDNIQVLCYQCHKEVHEEMGSRGRAGHQEAELRRTERAKEHINEIEMPDF